MISLSALGVLPSLGGLVLGGWLGRRLAGRGITADNALVGRQRLAYVVLLAAGGTAALLYFSPRIPLIPTLVALYADASVMHLARAVTAFALGLLALLEWPGRRDPKRRRNLLAGSAILAGMAGYLVWRAAPITGLLRDPWVLDGVVMQTTSYTCAPASIATLARMLTGDTTISERSVATLAGTTREGTNTLAEVRTMRLLGLGPLFARGLTPESLLARGTPALLHVDEPVGPTRIRHAVALLAVDAAARTVTVGNPLHGLQVKRLDELKGYWTGEAVLVTAARRAPPRL